MLPEAAATAAICIVFSTSNLVGYRIAGCIRGGITSCVILNNAKTGVIITTRRKKTLQLVQCRLFFVESLILRRTEIGINRFQRRNCIQGVVSCACESSMAFLDV